MAKSPSRTLCTALVTLLIALHVWIAWSSTLGKGPAFDEGAHMTAGYTYWKFNDYRLQPENGNLPQRWAGLAILPLSLRLPPGENKTEWRRADVWNMGQRFLFENGNPAELMLAASRGAMSLWGAAAALLVFFWSRRLWGDWGALLSLGLCAGSATMLAHSPMVTSDMVAAFCLLAASGAFWRQLRTPTTLNFGLSLLLTGMTALAKFSFVLLVPIYALLLVWHACARPTASDRPEPRKSLAADTLKAIGLTLAHALVVFLAVWTAFGFRYKAQALGMPPGIDLHVPWNDLLPPSGFRRAFLETLKTYRLLPEAYTHGFAYVLHASDARGAFAAGQLSTTGWWWFFPYAFILKSSLAELAAFVALVIIAIRKASVSTTARDLCVRLNRFAPLITLGLIYGLASVTSNLNIGHRHILPLYLPLFIMAGALARPSAGTLCRIFAAVLVLTQAVEALAARPNYLAYFNLTAGSPDQRWHHLVDSSLDWGQELPALSRWLETNRKPDEPVFLSYFGVDDPRRENMADVIQFAPYSSFWRKPFLVSLKPGLYCVSATLIQDTYSSLNGPWTLKLENTFKTIGAHFAEHPEEFDSTRSYTLMRGTLDDNRRWLFERVRFARLAQYLRVRRPDAVVNSAVLIYRLDEREVSLAVDAPTSVFLELIEEAYRKR